VTVATVLSIGPQPLRRRSTVLLVLENDVDPVVPSVCQLAPSQNIRESLQGILVEPDLGQPIPVKNLGTGQRPPVNRCIYAVVYGVVIRRPDEVAFLTASRQVSGKHQAQLSQDEAKTCRHAHYEQRPVPPAVGITSRLDGAVIEAPDAVARTLYDVDGLSITAEAVYVGRKLVRDAKVLVPPQRLKPTQPMPAGLQRKRRNPGKTSQSG